MRFPPVGHFTAPNKSLRFQGGKKKKSTDDGKTSPAMVMSFINIIDV